jgi:hypothetical protein
MRNGRVPWIASFATGISFAHSPRAYRLLLFFLVNLPLVIVIGSFVDGTWMMPGPAKGLAQHFGYWTIFATSPLIVFLSCFLFQKFTTVVQKTDQYCVGLDEETQRRLEKLVQRHLSSLQLRSRSAWILLFIVFVLLCWWVVNVVKVMQPLNTYGHDVFDSFAHPYGFYAARIYVLVVFAFVYSVAMFLSLHITVSLVSILKFLRSNEILLINLFHEDNCGGTGQFGTINLVILALYGNFFAVIYAMYQTHRQAYLVMVTSLVFCAGVAIAQSVVAVFHIHKAVAQKKKACIEAVAAKLNEQVATSLRGGTFPHDLLVFRNHLIGIHTFPYTAKALVAVNFIRFAPAVLAIFSYFKDP